MPDLNPSCPAHHAHRAARAAQVAGEDAHFLAADEVRRLGVFRINTVRGALNF